jgi:hypothetical protein
LVKEEIKGELKKSLETNKSENTVCHNVWGAAKAILRQEFAAINAINR